MPKVSIIVPVYNVEAYLDRCINSLRSQSLEDIEIILVDDGSPDNCPDMCDCYAKKDKRIKVIHKTNAGLGFARNSGLDLVTGEYVAFVDSDDYVSPDMYEILYRTASGNNCDVVYCGFRKEISSGNFLNVREVDEYKEYNGTQIKDLVADFIAAPPYIKKEYIHEMSVWHSVYRADIIKNNNIRFVSEREYVSEDVLFQIDFLKFSDRVAFIPDMLYVYCYNTGSLTKTLKLEKFEGMKRFYYLLSEKTVDYDSLHLRASRLFISYVRSFIRKIAASDLTFSQKKKYLDMIINDNIWNVLKVQYKPLYLPVYNGVMLRLIYNKMGLMLYLYLMVFNMFHR